jgi:outer membrane protein TolC
MMDIALRVRAATWPRLCAALCLVSWAPAARADEVAGLGATVEPLLEIARQMSPELAARALDVEAALARAEAAFSLPDPVFRTEFQDIERSRRTSLPDRLGSITYTVQQEFPLWGKRDLKRDQAHAEAESERARHRAAELELVARLKAAFAASYSAHQALRLVGALADTAATMAASAQARFARGRGGQTEAIAARLELAEVEAERIGLDGARGRAAAQLNALLNRPVGAPLAPPQALRPMPPADALTLDRLIERAVRDNPAIAGEDAQIAAAEHGRTLVAKSWYPDVTLGLSAVDRDRRFFGYEAMVEFKIPLRWGLREAQEREAAARLGAARARRDAARLRLQGELEQAYWTFQAAGQTYRLLHDIQVPQAELRLGAALAGYELGRTELTAVLDAQRQIRRIALEHLKAEIEQQIGLAEIERLVGGEL